MKQQYLNTEVTNKKTIYTDKYNNLNNFLANVERVELRKILQYLKNRYMYYSIDNLAMVSDMIMDDPNLELEIIGDNISNQPSRDKHKESKFLKSLERMSQELFTHWNEFSKAFNSYFISKNAQLQHNANNDISIYSFKVIEQWQIMVKYQKESLNKVKVKVNNKLMTLIKILKSMGQSYISGRRTKSKVGRTKSKVGRTKSKVGITKQSRKSLKNTNNKNKRR